MVKQSLFLAVTTALLLSSSCHAEDPSESVLVTMSHIQQVISSVPPLFKDAKDIDRKLDQPGVNVTEQTQSFKFLVAIGRARMQVAKMQAEGCSLWIDAKIERMSPTREPSSLQATRGHMYAFADKLKDEDFWWRVTVNSLTPKWPSDDPRKLLKDSLYYLLRQQDGIDYAIKRLDDAVTSFKLFLHGK